MDEWHDRRYFAPINWRRERFPWPPDAWRSVVSDAYERRLEGLLGDAEHVSDLASAADLASRPGPPVALWYSRPGGILPTREAL